MGDKRGVLVADDRPCFSPSFFTSDPSDTRLRSTIGEACEGNSGESFDAVEGEV